MGNNELQKWKMRNKNGEAIEYRVIGRKEVKLVQWEVSTESGRGV